MDSRTDFVHTIHVGPPPFHRFKPKIYSLSFYSTFVYFGKITFKTMVTFTFIKVKATFENLVIFLTFFYIPSANTKENQEYE